MCDLSTVDRSELAVAVRGGRRRRPPGRRGRGAEAARDPSAALGSTVMASSAWPTPRGGAGVPRVVYLSTVHVYGDRMAPGATLTEDMRPEPRSAYAISRLASEHVIAGLAGGAYELVILRLTNSVGAPLDPRVDRWSLVANDLARQGALDGRLTLAHRRCPVARLRGARRRLRGDRRRLRAPAAPALAARDLQPRVGRARAPCSTWRARPGRVRGAHRRAGRRWRRRRRRPSQAPAPYHVSVRPAGRRGVTPARTAPRGRRRDGELLPGHRSSL